MSNTILLRTMGHKDEAVAASELYPGDLIEYTSSGTVQVHSSKGGRAARMFAYEDQLQGKITSQAYSAADPVLFVHAIPGDRVQARIPSGENIAIGDMLVSNGDGCLIEADEQGQSLLYSNTAPSTVIEDTAAETAFDVTYSIPANFLQAGDVIRITGHITVVDQKSDGTLTIKVKIGSTVLLTTASVNVADSDIVEFDITILVRTIGATGTFVAYSTNAIGTPGTATVKHAAVASTAIDTTAAAAITVTQTFSTTTTTTGAPTDKDQLRLESLTVALLREKTQDVVAMAMYAAGALAAETLVPVLVM